MRSKIKKTIEFVFEEFNIFAINKKTIYSHIMVTSDEFCS